MTSEEIKQLDEKSGCFFRLYGICIVLPVLVVQFLFGGTIFLYLCKKNHKYAASHYRHI